MEALQTLVKVIVVVFDTILFIIGLTIILLPYAFYTFGFAALWISLRGKELATHTRQREMIIGLLAIIVARLLQT